MDKPRAQTKGREKKVMGERGAENAAVGWRGRRTEGGVEGVGGQKGEKEDGGGALRPAK